MRVTHWLHSLHDSLVRLTPKCLFEAGLCNGFEVAMNSRDYGVIEGGMPADLVVLDYDDMSHDIIDGMVEETDVLLTRATRAHVRQLIMNGREALRDGRAIRVDLDAIEKELLAQTQAAGPEMRALRPVIER